MRHREPRTDWTGWEPTGPVVRELRLYMRRHRRANVAAFLAVVASATYGLYDAARSRDLACRQANETRTALVTIIARGDSNVRKLYEEGTITYRQYRRSLTASREARGRLAPINCDAA